MIIDKRTIDLFHPPYMIADISGNHEQDFQKALKLIKASKDAGCDAVKFQTYKPEGLTMPNLGMFKGRDLFELYTNICMPYEWYPELFAYAKEIGIVPFTTVFNPEDVEWLEKLECPAYKISSYEINYFDLLEAVSATNKPTIVSTGCVTGLQDLVFVENRFATLNLMFFRCVSVYPAPPEQFNLKMLSEIRNQFSVEVGLSDHSIGSSIACASVALGATAVEKHITLSKSAIDGHFALLPDEMKEFVDDVQNAYKSIGSIDYCTTVKSREYMRSLYSIKDIKKGDLFTRENVGFLRPNKGISPKAIGSFMNKRASEDVPRGTPLHLRHIV